MKLRSFVGTTMIYEWPLIREELIFSTFNNSNLATFEGLIKLLWEAGLGHVSHQIWSWSKGKVARSSDNTWNFSMESYGENCKFFIDIWQQWIGDMDQATKPPRTKGSAGNNRCEPGRTRQKKCLFMSVNLFPSHHLISSLSSKSACCSTDEQSFFIAAPNKSPKIGREWADRQGKNPSPSAWIPVKISYGIRRGPLEFLHPTHKYKKIICFCPLSRLQKTKTWVSLRQMNS